MLYLTFFCTVTLTVYLLGVLRMERKDRIRRRINAFVEPEQAGDVAEEEENKQRLLWSRIVFPLWRGFKKYFKKRLPGAKEMKIEMRLLQAGKPLGMTPVDFRLLQIFLLLLLPVLFTLYGMFIQLSVGGIMLLIAAAFGTAVFLPKYYIGQKIKQRSKLALRELPDILDLLTVSLEAGLGFDSALSKLVSKKNGVLASEFQRYLEEIRLGKTRREALTGIRDRVVLEEIRVFISSILQAEKLGIGMVTVLRVQSQEVREQRKQRAEEAAMKAPIKMLFPLVLFIFPCLFIVLLGPTAIQFIGAFSK